MAPVRRRLIDTGLAAHIRLPGKVVRWSAFTSRQR
jgi:hypothetical protein